MVEIWHHLSGLESLKIDQKRPLMKVNIASLAVEISGSGNDCQCGVELPETMRKVVSSAGGKTREVRLSAL